MQIVGLSVVRVLAWIVRFCNCKSKQKKLGELDTDDLNHAEDLIIAHAQQVSFPVEYKLLKSQQPLPKSSKLLNLSPFIDGDIVKAETRLKNAEFLPQSTKTPVILFPQHWVTKLIVRYYHELNSYNMGTSHTQQHIREKFWIIRSRQAINNY